MTSHELARALLDGPDLPVHYAYSYGDYWKTTVAPEVRSVQEGVVTHSEYHNMDKVVDEDKVTADSANSQRNVIIID